MSDAAFDTFVVGVVHLTVAFFIVPIVDPATRPEFTSQYRSLPYLLSMAGFVGILFLFVWALADAVEGERRAEVGIDVVIVIMVPVLVFVFHMARRGIVTGVSGRRRDELERLLSTGSVETLGDMYSAAMGVPDVDQRLRLWRYLFIRGSLAAVDYWRLLPLIGQDDDNPDKDVEVDVGDAPAA